jgi:hypothetical protein
MSNELLIKVTLPRHSTVNPALRQSSCRSLSLPICGTRA